MLIICIVFYSSNKHYPVKGRCCKIQMARLGEKKNRVFFFLTSHCRHGRAPGRHRAAGGRLRPLPGPPPAAGRRRLLAQVVAELRRQSRLALPGI